MKDALLKFGTEVVDPQVGQEYRVVFKNNTGHTQAAKYTVDTLEDDKRSVKLRGYGHTFKRSDLQFFVVQ